jgi:sugar lactone lactonase YvrE
VTLTATVAVPDPPAGYTPTGNVTFVDYETGLPIGLPVSLSSTSPYTASTTVTSLPLGTDHVYAFYSGDANFVPSTSSQVAVSITPGVAVTTTKLPDVTVGHAYHATLAAAGGKQPYRWKLTTGSLPTGLSLTAGTGAISGTPTTTGTFSFTALVTDSTTPTAFKATAHLRIAVNPVIQPAVYVTNGGNSAVHSYALGASGDAAPLTTLAGATTGLNGTTAVAIAPDGRVFVASANDNSIREYPYGASGNVTPATTIAGDVTGLASPQALVLDGDGRLYVANAANNSITVYGAGATGNAKPIATLMGTHTALANPAALTIDGLGRLWVANLSSNSLTVYPRSATGDLAPSGTISGSATRLNGPHGLALDSLGNLLVADTYDNSITEYSTTLFGNVPPLRRIAGSSTGLSFPDGIDIDTAGNVYVANQFAGIESFSFPADGNLAPATSIAGPTTGLSAPGHLAVSPPLSVATRRLPGARLHRRYHATLRAYLGTTPYGFALTRGHLPPGLRLRGASITGRPRQTGTYRFTVRVRDASQPATRASRRLTITVRR